MSRFFVLVVVLAIALASGGCSGGSPTSRRAGESGPQSADSRSMARGLAGSRQPVPVLYRASTGFWYYLEQFSSSGPIADRQFRYGGAPGDVPVGGDWDGDGAFDVGLYRRTTGRWYLVTEWSGGQPSQDRQFIYGGAPSDIPLAGDFDGDGVDDPALYRPATQMWYLLTELEGSGPISDVKVRFGGRTEDLPAVGDFNGDGRSDLAVFTPSLGLWNLDYDLDGRPESTFYYGGPGDVPLAGDFDGDGREDPALYRSSGGRWFLLTERTATAPVSDEQFAYGGDPSDVPLVGDFDGDGRSDPGVYRRSTGWFYLLVERTAGQPSDDFQFRYGGDPSDLPLTSAAVLTPLMRQDGLKFATGRHFPLGFARENTSTLAATGDFNEDGRPDVVAVEPLESRVRVLDGAAGGFGAAREVGTPAPALDLAAGDFTGDGHLDLFLAHSAQASVLPGIGDGTFGPAILTAVDRLSWPVPGDLDGDGDLDLACVRSSDAGVLFGHGDGTFTWTLLYDTTTNLNSMTVADLDGDSDLDLTFTNGQFAQIVTLLGDGDGGFSGPLTTNLAEGSTWIAGGDVSGDGLPDVVTTRRVYRGLGTGAFTPAEFLPELETTPQAVALADLDGDGDLDAVRTFWEGFTVALHGGDGTWAGADLFGGTTQRNFYRALLGDLTGDGRPDVSFPSSVSGVLSVYPGRGDGTVQAPFLGLPSTLASSPGARGLVVADYNEDGIPDFAAGFAEGPSLFLGRDGGRLAPATAVSTSPMQTLAGGDLDSDGHQDLLVSGALRGIYWGRGDGTFLPRAASPLSVDFVVRVADLDLDGLQDLLALQSGQIQISMGLGDRAFAARQTLAAGVGGNADLQVADLDRDGIPDLLAGGSSDQVALHRGLGDGTFAAPVVVSLGSSSSGALEALGVADLDGDGLPDLVALNGTAQRLYVARGAGGLSLHPALGYDLPGGWARTLQIADLDRDATLDVALADQTSHEAVVLPGQGDGTLAAPVRFATSSQPHSVVVVDADADGRPDLATANRGQGTVTVLLHE